MPTAYTPAGVTFPAFPWNLVKDGEVYNYDSIQKSATATNGLFGLCMDGIAYLKDQLEGATNGIVTKLAKQTASSGDTLIGVLTYAGASLTLPTGTLRTALSYIADNAAKLGGANHFTASNNFDLFHGTIDGPIVTRSSTINPGSGVVIDTAVESYIWATPTIQQDVDVSFTSTVPRIGSTIWVTRPSTGAFAIVLHRQGQAAAIVTLPASTECGALLVWVGDAAGNGRWRLGYSTTGSTPGADA